MFCYYYNKISLLYFVIISYTRIVKLCRKHSTTVTASLMNSVLGNVLKLIKNNIGVPDAPWMNRIASG